MGDRNYYLNDSNIIIAYQQFMRDLAGALTNDKSMIDSDVDDIYTFEQAISKVILYSSIYSLSYFILYIVHLDDS